ncbi:MAG: zf-HC2 domain-containing protein [Candidatus Omnitrophota bacterium]
MKECAKVKRMLSRYLDKELKDSESAMIDAHLTGCSVCKKELSELSLVKKLVSGIERKTLPQDYLVSRLREQIADEKKHAKGFPLVGIGSLARRLIPVPAFAIIAVTLFLVINSMRGVSENSLEDNMLNGNTVTAEMALGVILGAQN